MSPLESLVSQKIISEKDAIAIEEESSKTGDTIEEILLRRGIDMREQKTSKGGSSIPKRSITKTISREALAYVPEESATYYRFVPLGIENGVLEVGIIDPNNLEARDALNFISTRTNVPYKLFLITDEDFKKALTMYKGLNNEVTQALSEFEIERKENPTPDEDLSIYDEDGGGEEDEKGKLTEDAPAIKIVDTILRYAVDGEASDVHVEPMRDDIRVRYRVDGVLHTSLTLPKNVHSALVARIKILSNMRLDEKRKPQDGRFSTEVDTRRVDLRVSTFPTYYGEKIVMRILDSEKGVKKLDDIGLSPRNLKLIKKALQAPYGLILISGPTGSGKTTTLYSMLNEVDRNEKNVLSLEDPVEYSIDGLNQSQVRPEIGYTFANGLRTTLRQDPDIIMVGEIRDKETAQLAIQAALTGHLVFSTIHTNNAFGVIPRLIDMGVDPYLIAPTLILAIAQRLSSALCPGSGKPIPVEGSIKMMVEKQFEDLPEKYRKEIKFGDKVYDPSPVAGCPKGIRGRVAVMEVMEMDKDIESIILKNPTEIEILKMARSKGMLTMKEDAILKAMAKEIPFEEINNF